MSKIEKALNRAAAERKLMVVRGSERKPASSTKDLVATSATSGAMTEIETRARSSEAIALMREPTPCEPTQLAASRIIYPEMGENRTVKAFREVRTKIMQASQGRNCIVMVTSVAAKSGSTFVALNLGAAFAFDEGKTALLVDCNLRSPALHTLVSGTSVSGLTDYLENPEMDVADIIHPVGIARLRVIPTGGRREIPAEYFTSVRMKQLLEAVRARYPERFILLDSPPMTDSADTQILAELCDYVILVVPYGLVSHAQIENCVKAIDKTKLLGLVFNNEPQLPDSDRKR